MLLVEDDRDSAEVLCWALELHGNRVGVVGDGLTAPSRGPALGHLCAIGPPRRPAILAATPDAEEPHGVAK